MYEKLVWGSAVVVGLMALLVWWIYFRPGWLRSKAKKHEHARGRLVAVSANNIVLESWQGELSYKLSHTFHGLMFIRALAELKGKTVKVQFNSDGEVDRIEEIVSSTDTLVPTEDEEDSDVSRMGDAGLDLEDPANAHLLSPKEEGEDDLEERRRLQ